MQKTPQVSKHVMAVKIGVARNLALCEVEGSLGERLCSCAGLGLETPRRSELSRWRSASCTSRGSVRPACVKATTPGLWIAEDEAQECH